MDPMPGIIGSHSRFRSTLSPASESASSHVMPARGEGVRVEQGVRLPRREAAQTGVREHGGQNLRRGALAGVATADGVREETALPSLARTRRRMREVEDVDEADGMRGRVVLELETASRKTECLRTGHPLTFFRALSEIRPAAGIGGI
jgi:hypothetical protein